MGFCPTLDVFRRFITVSPHLAPLAPPEESSICGFPLLGAMVVNYTVNSTDPLSDFRFALIFNIAALHIVSILGIAGNLFAYVIIRKSKELQTPCFTLIAGDCVSSAVMAAGFLENASNSAFQFTGLLSPFRNRALCYMTMSFPEALGIQASCLITLCISIDRLVSILNPMKYRQLGTRHTYVCLGICYSAAIAVAVGGIFPDATPDSTLANVIVCTSFFSPFTMNYLEFYGNFTLIFSVIGICLYGVMLITFQCRHRRLVTASTAGDNTCNAFMKQQLACMPMIKLMMGYYMVTGVGPEIGVTILSSSEAFKQYLPPYFYYGSTVKASASLTEVFALAVGSRQFRECARRIFKKQSTVFVRSVRSGVTQNA